MKRIWFLTLFLSTAGTVVLAGESFHFMKIKEIFPGSCLKPDAQYIVLQMYSAGQNLVTGTEVRIFDAAGVQTAAFVFPTTLPNGANQATILIATPQADTLFFGGMARDLTMTPGISPTGGKVCFFDPGFFGDIDCFSWGNYSGSSVGTGTPFNAPQGLSRIQAARRRTNIAGHPDTLNAGDDTNNSATDFVFDPPAPRNNAGVNGSVPASTCGNGTTEGLECCDDGNTTPGDGCDGNCQPEPPCVKGDVNFDGSLTAADVVLQLNCTFLGTGTCPLCATDLNCDGYLTADDVVIHLNVVFLGAGLPC